MMLGMAPDYDHLMVIQKVEVFEHALDSTSGAALYSSSASPFFSCSSTLPAPFSRSPSSACLPVLPGLPGRECFPLLSVSACVAVSDLLPCLKLLLLPAPLRYVSLHNVS